MKTDGRIFSIVIVSWNARAFLDGCLASIFAAKQPGRLEVIVVDNHSTDGAPEMVEERYPQVRVVRNEANLGFAAANNIGIRTSRGEYVFLINSDVTVSPDCIEKLALFMDRHPTVGVSGPTMLSANGSVGRSCRGFPTVWRMICHALCLDRIVPNSPLFSGYIMRYWKQDSTKEVDILGGWFLCTRRSALDQVGLLDERFFFYAEDMDWCCRFRLKGWQVMFVAEAQAVHYGGGSSKVAPLKYYLQEQRADLQLWKKYNSPLKCAMYYGTCMIYQAVRFVTNGVMGLVCEEKSMRRARARRNAQCFWWYMRGARD